MDDGKYEEAIEAFEAMNGYKDSVEQITACETGIKDEAYDAAVALMNDGKYEEAIAAFEAMNGYKDSVEQIAACETSIKDNAYDAAVALMKEGKYEEAIAAFEALNGYKDSTEKAESIKFEYEAQKMKYAEVGDYIYFGAYEQDNDKSNGKEDIEWLVLAKKDGKILVVSKYVLDFKEYNSEWVTSTWESCTLRQWLNSRFLKIAFTKVEQTIIETTALTAEQNPMYYAYAGKDTEDKVFLLSINEASKYFSSNKARMCTPTAYAKAQGVITWDQFGYYTRVNGGYTCAWLLRTPGDSKRAVRIEGDGSILYEGDSVCSMYSCNIRPALWIDLDAIS